MDTTEQNSFSVNNTEIPTNGRNSSICRIRFHTFLLCGLTEIFST